MNHLGLLWTLGLMMSAAAFGQKDPMQKSEERKKNSWYFADHLGLKQKSSDLDLLYRFYTAQGKSDGPEIESVFWGSFSTFRGNRQSGPGTSVSYGATLFLDNFVSGLTGLPTLNVVPGIQGARQIRTFKSEDEEVLVWGPTVRFFGVSQQDSQFRFSYLQVHNLGTEFPYKAWRFQLEGDIFLSPWLALTGKGYLPQARYGPKTSKVDIFEAWSAGVFTEVGPLRFGYNYTDERYARSEKNPKQSQLSQGFLLGFSY
jgi:hypothetical protein